jgi:uncharacterized membrane protein YidH (DUF202 family)
MSVPHDEYDPETDQGHALERTMFSWTRTALSFGAVGGVIVKSHVIAGLVVMAIAPVIWQLGRVTKDGLPPARMKVITVTVLLVSAVALVIALSAKATPLDLRPK